MSLNFDNSSGKIGAQGVGSSTAELTDQKIAWIRELAAAQGRGPDDRPIRFGELQGGSDDEARAVIRGAGSVNRTAEQLVHEVEDDMQAQATAAGATLGREEGIENAFQVFGWNADSIIGILQRHPAVGRGHVDAQRALTAVREGMQQ